MTIKNTSNRYDDIQKGLSALTSKVGVDRVADFLNLLSQKGEAESYAAIVKLLAAKKFSIEVEEITTGTTHHHSKIRSVCFHILHKGAGLDIRKIGSLFSRKESSVHRQITIMESIIARPKSDKIFLEAYAEINAEFSNMRSTQKQSMIQIRGNDTSKELESIEEDLRARIRKEMKDSNMNITEFSSCVDIPRPTMSNFMLGNRTLKTTHLIKIQKYFRLQS